MWPGRNPIGRKVRLAADGFHAKSELLPDGPSYEVIGVARDTLGTMPDGSDVARVYVPLPADRAQYFPIPIHAQGDPKRLMREIDRVVPSVDGDMVATSTNLGTTFRLSPSVLIPGSAAGVAMVVGLLGLLLASMGIYGTVSYMVVLRTREVGIRMALGAQKRDVLTLMLRQVVRPVAGGLIAGMILAVGASFLLHGACMAWVGWMGFRLRACRFCFWRLRWWRLVAFAEGDARGSYGGVEVRVGGLAGMSGGRLVKQSFPFSGHDLKIGLWTDWRPAQPEQANRARVGTETRLGQLRRHSSDRLPLGQAIGREAWQQPHRLAVRR